MDKVIEMVSDKAGISKDQAKTAVDIVVNFLKDKLPEGMSGQVDSLLKGGGDLGGIKDKLGGMFGK